MVANVSSSLLGVEVIIALPPVASVGDMEVQQIQLLQVILQLPL